MDNNSEIKALKLEDEALESVSGGAEDFHYAVFHIDNDWCICCGECEKQCPACAIHEDIDGNFSIDTYACISCGVCEGCCPVNAIREI